jgi:hypothetical protein
MLKCVCKTNEKVIKNNTIGHCFDNGVNLNGISGWYCDVHGLQTLIRNQRGPVIGHKKANENQLKEYKHFCIAKNIMESRQKMMKGRG